MSELALKSVPIEDDGQLIMLDRLSLDEFAPMVSGGERMRAILEGNVGGPSILADSVDHGSRYHHPDRQDSLF